MIDNKTTFKVSKSEVTAHLSNLDTTQIYDFEFDTKHFDGMGGTTQADLRESLTKVLIGSSKEYIIGQIMDILSNNKEIELTD